MKRLVSLVTLPLALTLASCGGESSSPTSTASQCSDQFLADSAALKQTWASATKARANQELQRAQILLEYEALKSSCTSFLTSHENTSCVQQDGGQTLSSAELSFLCEGVDEKIAQILDQEKNTASQSVAETEPPAVASEASPKASPVEQPTTTPEEPTVKPKASTPQGTVTPVTEQPASSTEPSAPKEPQPPAQTPQSASGENSAEPIPSHWVGTWVLQSQHACGSGHPYEDALFAKYLKDYSWEFRADNTMVETIVAKNDSDEFPFEECQGSFTYKVELAPATGVPPTGFMKRMRLTRIGSESQCLRQDVRPTVMDLNYLTLPGFPDFIETWQRMLSPGGPCAPNDHIVTQFKRKP